MPALCAHRFPDPCRVLLLQVIVPLLQIAATRCALTQALRGFCSSQTPLVSLHHIQHAFPSPPLTGWGSTHASPTLSSDPLRFRLLTLRNYLHLAPLGMADRDPLHDDRLAEAEADRHSDDGSVLSTLTAAMEAADRSPSPGRLATGPHGPPPPVPVTHPPAPLYVPGLTRTSPGVPDSTRTRPLPGTMPGEDTASGPRWWRSLAQTVMQHLQLTGPIYLHAPRTLREVHMWRSVRLVLEEADSDSEGERIDFQDADNALFDLPTNEAPPHTTLAEAAAEARENEESEAPEHDSPFSPPDTGDHGAPSGAGWVGLPQASSNSRPRPSSSSRSRSPPAGPGLGGAGAPSANLHDPIGALEELDSGDPLHMIHPVTATMAAESPFSTRPGDLVYEADDVSFNLSAASRCLEETRRTVEMLRQGNRHRRSDASGPASGSRSRSRSRGDDADRPGDDQHARTPHNPLVDPKPAVPSAWWRTAGKAAVHSVTLWRLQVVHTQPSTLPLSLKKGRSFAAPLASTGLPSQFRLQLSILTSGRYPHAEIAPCTLPGEAVHEARTGPFSSPLPAPSLAARLTQGLGHYLQQMLCVLPSVVSLGHIRFPFCHHSGNHDSASPTLPKYSRPGPNSRGSLALRMQKLIILLCLHPACAGSRAEARVAAYATEAAGGIHSCFTDLPASMPKQGGFPTHVKTRPPLNAPNTRSAKRAFKRACSRATRFGHTQYRGRTFTSAQVPESRRQAGLHPCTRRPRPKTEPAGLTVFSWNAGGLGGGVYDEVMTHLSASSIDIAIIQESKWTECMEYTSGPWSCIHSGCKTQKHAGLLVAVHTRVAFSSHLRFEHYLKGRLLHARVPLQTSDHRHLHIIAVYQKTHVVGDAKSLTQRQQVWQALHKCLNRIPARDSIAVVGDFNAPLRCLSPHVGPFVGAELSHPPDDVPDLEVILQTFRLTALNTWYPTPGGDHTFTFGKARSQIDYIMVRLSEASTLARQVRTLHQFQVGAARKGGAYHSPLQAQLAISRPCWVYSGRRPAPCIDHEALLYALDNPLDPINLHKIAQVRQQVATHVAHHNNLEGVQSLHRTLHNACLQIFPAGKAAAQHAPPVAATPGTGEYPASLE